MVAVTSSGIEVVTDIEDVRRWLGNLPAVGAIAVDTETSGLNWQKDKLLLLQLKVGGAPTLVADVRGMPFGELGDLLRPILSGKEWLKIGQNLNFDYKWIAYHLRVRMRRLYDTMLAEQVLTAGLLTEEANLAATAEKYLGRHLDKSIRNGFIGYTGAEPFSLEMLEYSAADVDVLAPIMRAQLAALKESGLTSIAQMEMKVLPVLAEAELRGVTIDKEKWQAHVTKLAAKASEIETALVADLQEYVDEWRRVKLADRLRAFEDSHAGWVAALSEWEAAKAAHMAKFVPPPTPSFGSNAKEAAKALSAARKAFEAGWRETNKRPAKPAAPKEGTGPINLGSAEQLGGALAVMGVYLPTDKKTGKYKTGKKILKLYEDEHPILTRILEYRQYQKLVEAFGENVLAQTDGGARLHAQFVQNGTATGRMSCRKPNLQQIPANELGAEFRNCFVSRPAHKLISADYSQIELRVLAEVAGAAAMLEAFDNGVDLHSATAARMQGVPVEELIAEKDGKYKQARRAAKSINFGIAYGLTAWGLSRDLRISKEEAQAQIDAYFTANPEVREWLDATERMGFYNGYSETILGRKRFFNRMPEKPNQWRYNDYQEFKEDLREWEKRRSGMARAMCNHPIQGSAADITKRALLRVASRFTRDKLRAVVVMVIHDEIVVEAHEADAEAAAAALVEEMEGAARETLKRVPVKAEVAVAEYWQH